MLIIFIILTILFFLIILFVLYHYFFLKKYVFKKKKEFDIKLKYLDFILNEQDKKHIEHLKNVAKLNDFYTEIFNDQSKKLNLLNLDNLIIKDEINKFFQKLVNRQYLKVKKYIVFFDKKIKRFEIEVLNFNDNLIKIFKPEEEAKNSFLKIKEKFNLIKEFYKKNDELHVLKENYDVICKDIERFFIEFNKNIVCAKYDEVFKILSHLNKLVNKLEEINVVMPQICVTVLRTIPNKIIFLENKFKKMISQNYNIEFLINDSFFVNFKKKHSDLILNLKKINYEKVLEESKLVVNEIENLLDALDKETEARVNFEKEIDNIFVYESNLENKIFEFYNFFSKINETYVIPIKKRNEFKEIESLFNNILILKRFLDNSVHSVESKKYSILFSKLSAFKKSIQEVEKKIREFFIYLNSLKINAENICNNTLNFYYNLRKIEKKIRDVNIIAFTEKYSNKLKKVYDYIINIDLFSKKEPIDIEKISDYFNTYLKCEADSIFNQVNKDFNMMKLTEIEMVFLNQNRFLPEIDDIFKQGEKFFYNGNFEQSFNFVNDFKKNKSYNFKK